LLHVFSQIVDHVEGAGGMVQIPPIDWDNIQIVETIDMECRLQVASEE
jgi:hypothetical protein